MSLLVVVDSRVRFCVKGVPPEALAAVRAAFSHENPQWKKLRAQNYPTGAEKRVIETWREAGDELSVPRGGMPRVRAVLKAHGVEWRVRDERESGAGPRLEVVHKLTLRPYQEQAVRLMIEKENCLLKASTGCGKSTVGFAIAARLGLPTIVIVWTGALADQWIKRSRSELGYEPGVIRGGKRELRPLTIAMQQTLNARGIDEEMRRYFGVVMSDEVQRAPAQTAFESIDPFPARYRFGISADHSRKDKKEFLTHDLFGEVGVDIPREQLADEGHVLDVEVRVVLTNFKADWYAGARGSDRNGAHHRLLEAMACNEARNKIAVDVAAGELGSGERAFVMSHRVEHCRTLAEAVAARGHSAGLLLGGAGMAAEFQRTVAALLTGECRAGVGTVQAIGQGLDVPPVAVVVVTMPIAQNRQLFGQVRGRVCRTSPETGKTSARLYYLHDPHVFGWGAVKNLAVWNKSVVVGHGGGWVEARRYLASIGR